MFLVLQEEDKGRGGRQSFRDAPRAKSWTRVGHFQVIKKQMERTHDSSRKRIPVGKLQTDPQWRFPCQKFLCPLLLLEVL